jgi:hypothetical protein
MNIKLSASQALNITSSFFEEYEQRETDVLYTDDNDFLFASMRFARDKNFFKMLKRMSLAVSDTKYPYIIINEKDFNILSQYLEV